MSYNKRVIFLVLLFVTIIVNIPLYFFLRNDTVSRFHTVGEVEVRIPASYSCEEANKNGWIGTVAMSSGKGKWVYIQRRKLQHDWRPERYFQSADGAKSLKLNENVTFGVHARSKNYRRYVYVFRFNGSEYWLESGTRTSTLLFVKKIADVMLESIRINGKSPFVNPGELIGRTTDFVYPRFSQPLNFILWIVNGTMVLTLLIVWLVFHLASRMPAEHQDRNGGGKVSVRFSGTFGRNQSIDAFVVPAHDRLKIFLFRKPHVEVPFGELHTSGQVKIGRTFFLRQDYISFFFEKTESVMVRRRRPIRRIRITLYMSLDEIREMLINTNFPFKDMLHSRF
jgi:hypothetical protein